MGWVTHRGPFQPLTFCDSVLYGGSGVCVLKPGLYLFKTAEDVETFRVCLYELYFMEKILHKIFLNL